MTTTPSCRAKDPSKCRYHGQGSAVNTAQLKLDMVKADEAYAVAHAGGNTVDIYRLYEDVKKTRVAYFATDEGDAIISHALSTGNGDTAYLTELQREARNHRYESELRDGGSRYAPPTPSAKKIPPFPARVEAQFVNGVKTIASIRDRDGNVTHYRYTEQGLVYVEVEDSQGNIDVDSTRTLGRAKDGNDAFFKAYSWFRRQAGV
jgi:YD repeat-containing protein